MVHVWGKLTSAADFRALAVLGCRGRDCACGLQGLAHCDVYATGDGELSTDEHLYVAQLAEDGGLTRSQPGFEVRDDDWWPVPSEGGKKNVRIVMAAIPTASERGRSRARPNSEASGGSPSQESPPRQAPSCRYAEAAPVHRSCIDYFPAVANCITLA
ncbi:hypothetical protein Micbo1qcDRAFT_162139 [Microdochium bolleyi]|uniref:Uncharacterized protein n=1 Tax=Microdochium bolleyi TaxID=196109 RepID=A0A136J492_9PEZI|nr:hypothetical protein Micbo1qcDRAFT_162139 [Microdochium bolleyi]